MDYVPHSLVSSTQQTNKYQYQYQWSKYKYKYQYLTFKYQYQYKYCALIIGTQLHCSCTK